VIESSTATEYELEVVWLPDADRQDPVEALVAMLKGGRLPEAVVLMELLRSDSPDDPALLYNLGLSYSDLGMLETARTRLARLLQIDPEHANGHVALGVALTRQGKYKLACDELQRAVELDPHNPSAYRNLGACLMRLDRAGEAVAALQRATELNPAGERAWYGLGQALEGAGDAAAADAAYTRVAEVNEFGEVAHLAQEARSRIAGQAYKETAQQAPRMDAVLYCLGAIERFAGMSAAEIQKVGFEIAILGMNGLDVNDATPRYRLRTLPGEFSGLHLVCIEYVAFRQVAPQLDIQFDLAAEYASALALYERRKTGDWRV